MSDNRQKVRKSIQKKNRAMEEIVKCQTMERIKALDRQGKRRQWQLEILQFIEKYPKDELGWFYYAKLLRRDKKSEEALQILEELDPSTNFMVTIDKIKCYLDLKKYRHAYYLCRHQVEVSENSACENFIKTTMAYLCGQLTILSYELSDYNYIQQQLYHYSQIKAFAYVASIDEFHKDVDKKKLFTELETVLPNVDFVRNQMWQIDIRFFYYPNVGVEKDTVANFLKVVTVRDSFNIVTMNPVAMIKEVPQRMISYDLYLNMLQQDSDSEKQKKFRKK